MQCSCLFSPVAPGEQPKNRRIRGLSTAELVGIIVIVGVLGALAISSISNLTSQAKANAGLQNAEALNTTITAARNAGAVVDTSDVPAAITALNAGVMVGSGATAIVFRVNPPILNPGSYSYDSTTNLFSYTNGRLP
jgi:type II secretory pathway pseudopilin PulG